MAGFDGLVPVEALATMGKSYGAKAARSKIPRRRAASSCLPGPGGASGSRPDTAQTRGWHRFGDERVHRLLMSSNGIPGGYERRCCAGGRPGGCWR